MRTTRRVPGTGRAVLPAALLLLATLAATADPAMAGDSSSGGAATALYFEVAEINPSLAPIGGVNLETPQACVEHFVLTSRQGKSRRAAAALDFRLHGEIDGRQAAQLAERFFFVLNQQLWIDWDRLPDRPDGLLVGSAMGQPSPSAGRIRRSILLGTIEIEGRGIPVSLRRLKPAGGEPRWLFSAQTVDNIDALWESHGPSWLGQRMPSWARQRWHLRTPIWQWICALVAVVLAPLLGYLFSLGCRRWISRQFSEDPAEICAKLRWPLGAMLAAMLLWLALDALGLPSEVATVVEPLSLIIFVSMAVWLAMRIATIFVDRILKTTIRDHHKEESAGRKRLLTQVAVTRHVVLLGLVLIGIAAVLMELDIFRTLGMTMLTSAGALAVVLSIAGRAVLGNLIAGLQIALAQPFRIGDTVVVEGNWGQIEDITYVDVIIRTWDQRRLVFPVGYFIANWFENWSKTDPYLIKPIYLRVDFLADVEAIRQRFVELVERDEDWCGEPDQPGVLVTDLDDATMTLRLTCGGADSTKAWQLVCRVREQLVSWLHQVEGGRYLPRRRLLLSEAGQPEAASVQEGDAPARERTA